MVIYGVGYGGSFTQKWENKHFDNEVSARRFMSELYDTYMNDFSRMGRTAVGTIDTTITIRNIKKNGDHGKWYVNVRLYTMTTPCTDFWCSTCHAIKTMEVK